MARFILGSSSTFSTPGRESYTETSDAVGDANRSEASSTRRTAWSWRYDSPSIWSYTVPAGNKLTLDSIEIFGSPVAPYEVRGPARYRLGTIYLEEGTEPAAIGEWFLDGVDAFQSAIMTGAGDGPSSAIRPGKILSFGDGITFDPGQEINVVFTPVVGAHGGIAPTVVRCTIFGENPVTGAPIYVKGTYHVASTLAWSITNYVVTAPGFVMKSIVITADTAKPVLAHELILRMNGGVIAELGHAFHSQGVSTPARYTIPFNGLTFGEGTKFELTGRNFLDLGQTFSVALAGELTGPDTYVMRAYNTALVGHVYWNANFVDSTGSTSGYPIAQLSDIVVIRKGST